jgi:hypothetical protein
MHLDRTYCGCVLLQLTEQLSAHAGASMGLADTKALDQHGEVATGPVRRSDPDHRADDLTVCLRQEHQISVERVVRRDVTEAPVVRTNQLSDLQVDHRDRDRQLVQRRDWTDCRRHRRGLSHTIAEGGLISVRRRPRRLAW